jgi:ketosteroid isomerase-like protein
MTAAADHAGVVRRAYDAFNSRDIDAAVKLMAEDVVWPDVTDGGFVHGRDEVREHWREQFDAVDPRVELVGIEALGDGRLRASVRQVVRSSQGDPVSDERLNHVYTIGDGRIERMEIEK